MSVTAEHVTSKEAPSVPDADTSSPPPSPPPPYSNQEQELPPYSAAPPVYPPLKTESTSICQPGASYEPSADVDPEATPQTASITDSSPFDDKTVRRGFVRKVGTVLTHLLLQVLAFIQKSYYIEFVPRVMPS